jgi:uncharacterized membrane protein
MNSFGKSFVNVLVTGLIVIAPIYLALLLLLKALQSLAGVVRPVAVMFPERFPAENVLAVLLLVVVCFIVGGLVRTPPGRAMRARLEESVFRQIPGYEILRGLTRQLAHETEEREWMSALIEIEDALVPGFIIEEIDDGRFVVFVPSVPTPFAGAIYIIDPKRVHPLDVPFAQAAKTVARWGSGSRELVAAMKSQSAVRQGASA